MFDAVMDLSHELHALLTRGLRSAKMFGKVELVHGEGGGRCGHREGGEKKQQGRHYGC